MSRRTRLRIWAVPALLAACAPPAAEREPGPTPEAPAAAPGAASSVAFILEERDLLPESVAHDPLSGAFYVGSARKGKIVRVAADGSVEDFVASRRDGLWMILGMKVDPSRRHLWVASSEGAYLEGHEEGRGNAAGLFQFDLEDGSLLGRWTLAEGGGTHFFNDLVVTPAGDVYVTHMFNQTAVHVLLASDPRLQVFARPGSFRGANGIALAPDGSLYVASREGIGRFDPATAARTRLALPEGASFTPIDGLYHHSGSLIGIHPEENIVRRFVLDPTSDAITEIEVLEADHPALAGPTTGVIVGDDLYYVANPGFDQVVDGELPPLGELEESVILRLPLNR